jgi:GntR family transcriptional regulator/MocR family aminotransferase
MDFTIALDNYSTLPLYRQLYEELRRLILSGRLVPGQRLPSTRALARSLSISRATVTQSYEQLLSEGYLQTVTGSGTFVCAQLPDDLLRASIPIPSAIASRMPAGQSVRLSTYGASLLDTDPRERERRRWGDGEMGEESSASIHPCYTNPKSKIVRLNFDRLSYRADSELVELHAEVQNPKSPISFRYGSPAFDEIPLKQWRQLLSRHCRMGQKAMFDYASDSAGYRPLREAIARYLVQSRAVQCDADQVIIVSGSQQALDLVTRVLVDRGDEVAIENPGYLDARRIFLAQGAKLWPLPVDESGVMVERLRLSTRSAAHIKLIYVTPSHQFPTGAVLSLPRRLELLAWATQAGAMIIEDDYDSEFRYGGRPIPALQGLDQGNSVIYIGTFSKVLFPALRVGYLVVPKTLVRVLANAKRLTDRHGPLLEQQVLTDFINEGYLERHIRRMRTLYDQRRQTLMEALLLQVGKQVTILGENAGMHLMIRLHTPLSDDEIIGKAAQLGLDLVNAESYYLEGNGKSEFVIGYADLSLEEITEGVQRLAQVLNDQL